MNSTIYRSARLAAALLLLLLLALAAGYALAQEPSTAPAKATTATAKPATPVARNGYAEHWQAMRRGQPVARRAQESLAPFKVPIAAAEMATQALSETTACTNLLANPRLNFVELGDGTGTAEPWVFLEPITYFVHESWPEGGWLALDGYSLYVADGDSGDPSPLIDVFGQGFIMPGNLTDVSVDYWRWTIDGNAGDTVWGELWLLDDQGYLHWDDPDTYLVGWWEVDESEEAWALETVTAPEDIVNDLSGQPAALLFYNFTDGSPPTAPESQKEWMVFDDITLTACYKPQQVTGKRVFLPSVSKPGEAQPTCVPPTENPRDEFHSNRGFTQTGATCDSTLSNVDTADYYSYVPTRDGQHILHLQKLPKDSEWSAMIFTDEENPKFAPGQGDGDCRIIQPGAKDKQVTCDLQKNKKYFVKVSTGSTPLAASYRMKIVTP